MEAELPGEVSADEEGESREAAETAVEAEDVVVKDEEEEAMEESATVFESDVDEEDA